VCSSDLTKKESNAEIAEKPKSKAGRKPKVAEAPAAAPVAKVAEQPTKIPATFPAKSKAPAKPKLEIKKEESHTDSGSEHEAPAPKVKKVKPTAPTVVPAAAPVPATPESAPAPAKRGKFAKGSEEAKKYMADLRARQKSKKPAEEAPAA
jgi:hypothetical protein